MADQSGRVVGEGQFKILDNVVDGFNANGTPNEPFWDPQSSSLFSGAFYMAGGRGRAQ